ncbi:ataxin-2 like protein, putative [Babesia caballi]|uniref:Ataxin-2 like protein, putative n=1 Tax=Babesia caballi TaxID=5871 RepID=A0AAV4LRI1_BABCB|nr:ataxin-2 like protein, putative [Babesia caballi]
MRSTGSGQQHGHLGNGYKNDKRMAALARITEERLAYSMSCLIGKEVMVSMSNGCVVKGNFYSFDPMTRNNFRAVDVALRQARFVHGKVPFYPIGLMAVLQNDENHVSRPYVVYGGDYNYIVARGVNFGNSKRLTESAAPASSGDSAAVNKRYAASKFKTDTEISGSRSQRSTDKLVEWTSDQPVDKSQLYELDDQRKTEWDQFESNRKEFGVESTYDENLYTTELKPDEVPQHVHDNANRLAAEMEGRHREGTYSHLETFLEQDDELVDGSSVEAMVKKSLARSLKELRREERRESKREERGVDRKEDRREERGVDRKDDRREERGVDRRDDRRKDRRDDSRDERRDDRRDDKRDDKNQSGSKSKSRQSGGEAAPNSHSARSTVSNRLMSYKDIIASGASSYESAKQSAGQDNSGSHHAHTKGHGSEHDGSHHSSSHTAASDPQGAKPETAKSRNASGEGRSLDHSASDEGKMVERKSSLFPPQKSEEKLPHKPSLVEMKPGFPPTSTTETGKKTFTFNPNASCFTPISSINQSAHTASPSHSVTPVASKSPALALKATAVDPSGTAPVASAPSSVKDSQSQPSTASHAQLNFRAFSPMTEYPSLDVRVYTDASWVIPDPSVDEEWPNCSDASYRSIIGDLSQMHVAHSIITMRPQHPMVSTLGRTTVLLPQGGPVNYPAYQIGGIPVSVVPYGRQMTPKFYTSPQHAQQAMQPMLQARRNMTAGQPPSVAHHQPAVKPKMGLDR